MKLLSDYMDILIVLPFCLGVLWAADQFCRKFLGISRRREWLFLILVCCGWLLRNMLGRMSFGLYSFLMLSRSVFFVGLVMLLYLPWTLFIKSRSQILSNPSFQEPLTYILDEEGLTVSQGEAQEKMAWGDMHKAVSTGRSIIVYTSRVNATIFPKRQMGDQRNAVIEMISTHMPPARVKIRS